MPETENRLLERCSGNSSNIPLIKNQIMKNQSFLKGCGWLTTRLLLLTFLGWCPLVPTSVAASKWDVTGEWPMLGAVIKSFAVNKQIMITNQNFLNGEFSGYEEGTINLVHGSVTDSGIDFYVDGVLGVQGHFVGVLGANCMGGGNGVPGELTISDTGGTWHGFWGCGDCSSTNRLFPMIGAPFFTAQPSDVVTNAGALVQFRAVAAGYPGPSYQWQFNGGDIYGATNAIFTIPAALPGDSGEYRVVVANSAGTNVSRVAHLTLLNIQCVPGLFIYGPVGASYSIQARIDVAGEEWQSISNVTLTAFQPFIFADLGAYTNRARFYRAVLTHSLLQ